MAPGSELLTWLVTLTLVAAGSLSPRPSWDLVTAALSGLVSLFPVVAMAALLAGALAVSDWSERVMALVAGGTARAVLVASAAGALKPVCGLGVLPLIATLLRRGVPLAPVMAFWVSSPVMGPPMAVITAGVLGVPFAAAKGAAAFGIGLLAGALTSVMPGFRDSARPLMRPEPSAAQACGAGGFWTEAWTSARLVLRWLALALVLEILIQRLVPQAWIASLFGEAGTASVPLAALVGAPLYVDGYAALPLVRGLMDKGMAFGPALAFMVSGAAVSLYAAVAVAAIVRARVFVLYLFLAVLGAVMAGYLAAFLVA